MLEAKSLSKRFGGQVVLQEASLFLRPGEVVGLVGYNGSGKSTLLDIVSGMIRPDQGEVWVDGRRLVPKPIWGKAARVFRTYQVPRLFRRLSVIDNLRLGMWGVNGNCSLSSDLAKYYGDLCGDALSVGQRRRITLDWLQARLDCFQYFLLDEPAAGADQNLVGQLLNFINSARARGCGILLVEHRDGVLRRVCDRVLYLRDGVVSNVMPVIGSTDAPKLPTRIENGSANRLAARDISVARGSATVIKHVSLEARPGQVIVITGPNGCGKSTILGAIYGDPSCTLVEGELRLGERDLRPMDLRGRNGAGIQLMPQDGNLFQSMTVEDVLKTVVEAACRTPWVEKESARLKDALPPLGRIWSRKCGLLSGGERRLVSFARLLLLKPKVALLDEPLAGIDASSRELICRLISRITRDGTAVVVAEQEALVNSLPSDLIVRLDSSINH